jgi:hypothetical protein
LNGWHLALPYWLPHSAATCHVPQVTAQVTSGCETRHAWCRQHSKHSTGGQDHGRRTSLGQLFSRRRVLHVKQWAKPHSPHAGCSMHVERAASIYRGFVSHGRVCAGASCKVCTAHRTVLGCRVIDGVRAPGQPRLGFALELCHMDVRLVSWSAVMYTRHLLHASCLECTQQRMPTCQWQLAVQICTSGVSMSSNSPATAFNAACMLMPVVVRCS